MLLVYTHKLSPRLTYIFKHICSRILGVPVSFTTVVEEFIMHKSMKMSYTKQPLGNEVYMRSHDFMFEQGLSDLEINVQAWEDTKCFFATSEKSSLPFDIFAASFYLISRYEEYLPHVKDDYGRFLAADSIAFTEGFLHQPVVDIWAYKFKKILKREFPDFQFPENRYNVQPIIDVPVAYYFKHKGFLRTVGGTLSDLAHLRLKHLSFRYLTMLGFKRDPYDTFKWIITKQRKYPVKFIVFFLIGDYSTYDKNININKKEFMTLIKSIADYCKIGLKASFYAIDHPETLKTEKQKLESVINDSVKASRHSHTKLNIPESYRNLIDLEITNDYNMGYVDQIGFRAGTCTPFQFYDLDFEIQTPLQVHPTPFMDYSLLQKQSLLDKKQALLRLIKEIKNVNGTFMPIFHNYSFSDEERWKGFRELFSLILESPDEV